MKKHRNSLLFVFVFVLSSFSTLGAQDETEWDEDAMFSDIPEETRDAVLQDETGDTQLLVQEGIRWGGEITSTVEAQMRYTDLLPAPEDWLNFQEQVGIQLGSTLFFDARPSREHRVFGKFKLEYPFTLTNSIPNLQIFELFTDFNWNQQVFFRFGKQALGWGLSRFYQVADPLSEGTKDPQAPESDLEGPLALKINIPLGANNVDLYTIAKNSYLPADLGKVQLSDMGYGARSEWVFDLNEFTVGAFYQKKLAPKLLLGWNTSFGDVDFFTDQILAWGSDQYRLTSQVTASPEIYGTEKKSDGLTYTATVGFMYEQTDWKMTLYGEYLFQSEGSQDPDYLIKLSNRYLAETGVIPTVPDISGVTTISLGDLLAYNSQHYSSFSLSFSELGGLKEFSAQGFWQQNWIDQSGFAVFSAQFQPEKVWGITVGTKIAYGEDSTEFVTKMSDFSSDPPAPRRLSFFAELNLGSGKF